MSSSSRLRAKRLLPFGLMIASTVFFFNPNINLYDLLPDAIGYALLMLALRYASDAFQHFDAAYRGFRILFWINVAKIPAILLMLRVVGINLDERAIITVFSLAFAVVEWIFAVPAFRALFEGFAYIGEREGVRAAVTVRGEEAGFERLNLVTVLLLIVKGAGSFLPELVFVPTAFRKGSVDPSPFQPAAFYPIIVTFVALIVLVFGLVWMVSMIQYLSDLKRDTDMTRLLEEKALAAAPELLAREEIRRQKLLFLLTLVGFFFAIDLPLNNIDFLPDYVAAFAFLAVFFLTKKSRTTLWGKIFASLYAAFAILRTVCAALFFSRFEYRDVGGFTDGKEAAIGRFVPLMIAYVLEAVFFLLTVLFVIKLLREFVLRYTGKSLRPQDTVIRNEVHADLHKKCGWISVGASLYALLRPVCTFLLTLRDRHVITEDEVNEHYEQIGEAVYFSRFAWLWILVLIAGAVLFVISLITVRAIKIEANLAKEDE